MGKKICILVVLIFFISSIASASYRHGNFEGNPVVKVTSNGTELKIEDVPAINYKNRTMVPIYLLKQLGIDVQWNQDNYSVNVTAPTNGLNAQAVQENSQLESTLLYLSDFDVSMLIFIDYLKYASEVENFQNYKTQWEADFDQLKKRSQEITMNALKINDALKSDTVLNILKHQSQALDQLQQSKNMLSIWATEPNNLNYKNTFKISMLNSVRAVQMNYENTKDALHDLFLNQINNFNSQKVAFGKNI